jgi:hypothetical protein
MVGYCSYCVPRLARVCRSCRRDISAFTRDFLCRQCRDEYRKSKPVLKPGCFTTDEWEGNPRKRLPSLKEEYRYSPCRDCEPGYRLAQAREGRCDLYVILEDGSFAQLVSDEVMKEMLEVEVKDEGQMKDDV